MSPRRVVIAGGTGFIGVTLTKQFQARGYGVVVLTRSPRERADGVGEVEWDGLRQGGWIENLDGAEAVINLAGKNINCPHTPRNVRELTDSRVNSVRAIAAAISRVAQPPRVWVQAGAIGFYGDTSDRWCDEASPAGHGTLANICRDWEAAFLGTAPPLSNGRQEKGPAATRRVLLRIGMVLGRAGGALPVLARLTKWFLGGAAGSGRQFVSWVHLEDLGRVFVTAVERTDLAGVFNAVAPNPVTNAEFMRQLRRVVHRPWSPPVPAFAMRLGGRLVGVEPSLALISQRCAPKRLAEMGFKFQFRDLDSALEDLCRMA
jgi:uncharacterized protein